jgi:hypothetical protein
MRSLLVTTLLALACACACAAPASAVETGVNETLGQTRPTGQTASQLGAHWVRLWGSWEAAQPAPNAWAPDVIASMNAAVRDAKAHGLKVLMVVQRSPAWASGGKGGIHPPTDPATFGAAMGGLASRVPGVDAWELWNEEDETIFFAGGANPAKYAAMVKAAYPAIKAVQPHDIVVTGATVANDFDFIEALYRQGIKGSFDAVGVHTDTACLVNSPDVHYREPDGRVGRYSFTGYREVHAVMARHGDGDKQIWMTELGWNTQSTAPGSCNTGMWAGQKPLGVTEAQQAQYLAQAYRCLAADPYIGVALWFGLQDIAGSKYAAGYGLYRRDGSAKPSAGAFGALRRGIAPLACGGTIDTSGPEIRISEPLDGAKFVKLLPIDARAVDSAGGVGIRRIEIWADGKLSRSFGDGHAKMRSFWPVADWKRGKHTLTFKAEDEAGNKASRTITVTKVKRLPKVKTAATLALELLDAATVRVTGGVSSPKAHASVKLRGKAFVVFQKRVENRKGKRKWKRVHRIKTRASKAVDATQTLKPGKWRVFLAYPGRKGFKKSRSKPLGFSIAAAAPPALPPA